VAGTFFYCGCGTFLCRRFLSVLLAKRPLAIQTKKVFDPVNTSGFTLDFEAGKSRFEV
jgi:hypothetical protein